MSSWILGTRKFLPMFLLFTVQMFNQVSLHLNQSAKNSSISEPKAEMNHLCPCDLFVLLDTVSYYFRIILAFCFYSKGNSKRETVKMTLNKGPSH